MPKANRWLVRAFRGYAARYLRKHFHAVRLSGSSSLTVGDGPILVAMNHPSWWDPLIGAVLSRLFAGREHAVAMDAAALRQYPLFRRLGFFAVEQGGARGAAEFLRAGLAALSQSNGMLWVTPQGRFADARERPLALKPGIGALAARLRGGVVLPVALDYVFWSERTPEALVRFGDPLRIEDHPDRDARAWKELIEARLTDTLDALTADALTRDPERFTTLIQGKVGIGGVYDLWRKLKAWSRGRRFEPAHAAGLRERRP
jgi:1-acyl-sn-glycerol-3-phosphate acyltransferase